MAIKLYSIVVVEIDTLLNQQTQSNLDNWFSNNFIGILMIYVFLELTTCITQ